MKKFGLLVLFATSLVFGQGVFVPPQTAFRVVNGYTSPIARATITVCAAGASGIPCSPALVGALFLDAGLSEPLPNPFTADSQGNYQFAIVAGTYTVTVSNYGFAGNSYQITVGGSGGGGGGSSVFYQGPPSGAVNGSNTVFTLSSTPPLASDVSCFENGLQQVQGAGNDYTVFGPVLTWNVAPLSGYTLNCQWLAAGSTTTLNQGPPSGAINGLNTVFTLSPTPTSSANVNCFLNGLQQLQGSGNDYAISGPNLTWQVAPLSGYRINCLWF